MPAETNLNNEFYTFLVGRQDLSEATPLRFFEQRLEDNSGVSDIDDQYLWVYTGDSGGGRTGPSGRELQATNELVMLNVDLGLVADFAGYIDPTTGEVTCILNVTQGSTEPACPAASTLDQAALYKYDNLLWLNDFRDVFTKMTLHGHEPDSTCTSLPCPVLPL